MAPRLGAPAPRGGPSRHLCWRRVLPSLQSDPSPLQTIPTTWDCARAAGLAWFQNPPCHRARAGAWAPPPPGQARRTQDSRDLARVRANTNPTRGACERGRGPTAPAHTGPPGRALPHSGPRVPVQPAPPCSPSLAHTLSARRRPAPLRSAPLRSAGATCRSCGRPPPPGPAGFRWPSPRRSPLPPRAGT